MTPQRRVVAEVLHGEHVHLTAEEVHQRARELLPEISLATVYNTLNELAGMGEVIEVAAGQGPMRYDPNTTHHHQHLVCVTCGAIRDVNPDGERQVRLPVRERHGYTVHTVEMVFRGQCPDCQAGAPV